MVTAPASRNSSLLFLRIEKRRRVELTMKNNVVQWNKGLAASVVAAWYV